MAAIRAAAAANPPATVTSTRNRRYRSAAASSTRAAAAIVTWTRPVSTCPAAVAGPTPVTAAAGRSRAGSSTAVTAAAASTKAAAISRITSPGCRYRAGARTRPRGRVFGPPAASSIAGESVMGSTPRPWPPCRAALRLGALP